MVYLAVLNMVFLLLVLYMVKKCVDYRYDQKTFRRLMDHINIGYYRYRYRDVLSSPRTRVFLKSWDLIRMSLM